MGVRKRIGEFVIRVEFGRIPEKILGAGFTVEFLELQAILKSFELFTNHLLTALRKSVIIFIAFAAFG